MLSISALPCLNDNYIWLLRQDSAVIVVDPGESAPVLDYLQREQCKLVGILLTHRHGDHTGGVTQLAGACPVYGPPEVAEVNHPVQGGELIMLLGQRVQVLATPGHTREHLSYLMDGALFCGDTLFGAGCGRVFDGEPQALFASLQRLAALPGDTRVYCAHEYTLGNLQFALAVEPGNPALQARWQADSRKRQAGESTLPSSIALELATNPFLRSSSPAVVKIARQHGAGAADGQSVFIALREWKNHFK